MRRVVWKYPIEIGRPNLVTMPAGAEILHVAVQGDALMAWALVDPDNTMAEVRDLRIIGTGHIVELDPADGLTLRYIGTVHLANGALVFHAFEVAP